ncbi:glycosyltransferase, partial [Pseudomonas sp.]
MIAVIIPAHNEARRLGRCLKSVKAAALLAEQAGHRVEVLVVLDRCSDGSAGVADRHGVAT